MWLYKLLRSIIKEYNFLRWSLHIARKHCRKIPQDMCQRFFLCRSSQKWNFSWIGQKTDFLERHVYRYGVAKSRRFSHSCLWENSMYFVISNWKFVSDYIKHLDAYPVSHVSAGNSKEWNSYRQKAFERLFEMNSNWDHIIYSLHLYSTGPY